MGIYIDMALLAIMLIFLIVSAKRGFLITLLEVLVFCDCRYFSRKFVQARGE